MLNIEGRNPVVEALETKRLRIKEIYLQEKIVADSKINKIIELAESLGLKIKYVNKHFLDKLSVTDTHQGVIAITAGYTYVKFNDMIKSIDESNRDPFIMIVRESLYDHNLGAILRTASAVGVNGVIISSKSNISEHVVRTSMGAINYLNIVQLDVFSSIKQLKDLGIKIAAIEQTTKSVYLHEAKLLGPIALIIGGEDHALSDEITNKCDLIVKLPMLSKINSLNMSVAAGVVMYEKLRQELVSE